MNRRVAHIIASVVLIFGVSAAAGCGSSSSPIAPAPVSTTDTFTGVVAPLGSDSHTFTVNYTADYSTATATITSLKTVANGTPVNITIGVAFGTANLGFCTPSTSFQNPVAAVNQPLPTTGAPFVGGQANAYCIQVFDNPAAPTVPEPINYTITVQHY
jgi:hypothetical protein